MQRPSTWRVIAALIRRSARPRCRWEAEASWRSWAGRTIARAPVTWPSPAQASLAVSRRASFLVAKGKEWNKKNFYIYGRRKKLFFHFCRLEVQADVTSTQRFSLCSETASATTSLSEKSVYASIAMDDGAASTRALAGSIINFKVRILLFFSFVHAPGGN